MGASHVVLLSRGLVAAAPGANWNPAPENLVEIHALESDRGSYLGYVRAIGRRRPDVKLDDLTLLSTGSITDSARLAIRESPIDRIEIPPSQETARARLSRGAHPIYTSVGKLRGRDCGRKPGEGILWRRMCRMAA